MTDSVFGRDWGFKSQRMVERERNWGLARNVVDGVSAVVAERGRAIVLEDDIEVSPGFLGAQHRPRRLGHPWRGLGSLRGAPRLDLSPDGAPRSAHRPRGLPGLPELLPEPPPLPVDPRRPAAGDKTMTLKNYPPWHIV